MKRNKKSKKSNIKPSAPLFRLEDITEIISIAENISLKINEFKYDLTEKTDRLERRVSELEKEMDKLEMKL